MLREKSESSGCPLTMLKNVRYIIIVDVCAHPATTTWKSEDNFVELVFSFHLYAVPGSDVTSPGLLSRCPSPLGSFTGPCVVIF